MRVWVYIVIKDILVLGFYCYNGIGTSLLSEVRHKPAPSVWQQRGWLEHDGRKSGGCTVPQNQFHGVGGERPVQVVAMVALICKL